MIYEGIPKPGTGNLFSLLPSSFPFSSHWLACPLVPQNSPLLTPSPSPYPLSLSSLLSPSGSCRFSVPSSLFPWFPLRPSPPPRPSSPLLLNSVHHPRGIPTFLTATTAFIPSTVSGRRAYKDDPEFNKSDNVRVFRVYTVSQLAVPDNRQLIDFANANTFGRYSDRLINL